MKKLLFLLFTIFAVSCNDSTKTDKENPDKQSTPKADAGADNKNINAILDSMHTTLKGGLLKEFPKYLSDDGLFLGTDPGEYWTKQGLMDYMKKTFPGDTFKFVYNIEKREVLMDDAGRSALVIEQFYLPNMSRKIMVRAISRVDRKDDKWTIDFYSWNMIPRNEDIDKLNKALE